MAKIKPRLFIMIGPQGSGKGTQAELLAKKLNLPVAVTGDILRAEIESGSEVGKRVKALINKGNLVTIDLWEQIMGTYLKNLKAPRGVIIDGSPRTYQQAQAMERIISKYNLPKPLAIYLDLPRDKAIKRLLKRQVCVGCRRSGAITDPEECRACGGKMVQRADDNIDAINRRLDLYEQETAPLIDYFAKRNELVQVNGDQSIQAVHQNIVHALKTFESATTHS